MDFRLHGEFIQGTESWISLGLLKAIENQNNRGYIPRPTDQRFKFALLFQDYVPSIPNLKINLNLVYNSGLPVGSPSLGELLAQGKANIHAPWLGLSGFFVLALMLSLLVFIGEGVRDAFDPRHRS